MEKQFHGLKQNNMKENFTEEDLDSCWLYYKSYLLDILNGEYDLEQAREDLRGLVGSSYDKRVQGNLISKLTIKKED